MFFDRRIPAGLKTAYNYDSLGGILYGAHYGFTIAFFPIIARKLGASSGQMAFLTTTSLIGALFTFFWAHYSNNRKKMPFIIRMKGTARVLLFLMVLVVNPWAFIFIVFLYWFFEMAGSPAYAGIMKEIYSEKHRGKAMGYVRVEMGMAMIVSSWLAGLLLDRFSYRYVFPAGAVFGLFALLSFRRIRVKSDERVVPNQKKRFSLLEIGRILKRDKRFLRYSAIIFTFGFGNLIIIPLCPIFLVDTLRITNTLAGRLASLFSLCWVISYLFWGEFIDRKGPLNALWLLLLLVSFVPALYFFASNIWFAAIATIFSGLSSGGTQLARVNYITRIVRHEQVADYWGVDYTLMGLRGIVAPFVGVGLMHLLGIRAAFLIGFVLIFSSFIAMRQFAQGEEKELYKPKSGN